MKNKKILRNVMRLCLVVALQLLICGVNFAANHVTDINIGVLINDDGSADVTQEWIGSFNEGTENYLPISDKSLKVSNLQASLNGRKYEYQNFWNVNSSFNDKKYKCGINKTYDGIELCYGISEYGNNTYVFSYHIDPLVKSYTDYDGFNFMFLNPDMSIYPSNMNLQIRMANGKSLSEENARIWGFGFDGEVWLKGGNVVAYTNERLYGSNSVIIMLCMNKGIINPRVHNDYSFQDVQKKALDNSSYQKTINDSKIEDLIHMLFFVLFAIVFFVPIIIVAIVKISRIKKLKKFYKQTNYFRDTPNKGNIAMSHALFTDFDIWRSNDSNVIGALIMKMIYDKNLELMEEKSVGFFGIEKKVTNLRLASEPKGRTEKKLYDIIKLAAGEDNILQEKELKKYSKKNYTVLTDFLLGIEKDGRNDLNLENGYRKLLGKGLNDLTSIGQSELSEVYGLRKFLDEFTLVSEREIREVIIWENLLIYATLFGLAKKVLKDLKKVYPEKIVEIENYSNTVYVSDMYFRAMYYSSIGAKSAADAAKMAASGFGGATSLGGGGGFSGGGSGGGSR